MITTKRRHVKTFVVLGMAAVAIGLGCLPGQAQAQIFMVCGDVDDNGGVTVTDGVQVLRAAAGLSSDCTDAICDIDVNGTISVTDGVITLRKAAGLSIKDNCIPDEGTINQQVAHLVQRTQRQPATETKTHHSKFALGANPGKFSQIPASGDDVFYGLIDIERRFGEQGTHAVFRQLPMKQVRRQRHESGPGKISRKFPLRPVQSPHRREQDNSGPSLANCGSSEEAVGKTTFGVVPRV